MSKTFKKAPKPKPLTAEIISAFEQGGAGQDTQKHKSTLPQTHITTKKSKGEPKRRLSIDLPESLHRRFKTACSKTDKKMQAEAITLIERRTAELEKK